MKNKNLIRLFSLTLVIALGSALAPAAHARTRTVNGQGSRGGTFQRQTERSPGNVSKNTTVTNPAGQTATRTKTAHVDPATGSLSAASSTTLPDGRTASRTLESQKTETGRTTNATATGPNGKTATYNSTSTKTETGFTREATATGPAGGTAEKQVTVSKENGVITRTVTKESTPPQP